MQVQHFSPNLDEQLNLRNCIWLDLHQIWFVVTQEYQDQESSSLFWKCKLYIIYIIYILKSLYICPFCQLMTWPWMLMTGGGLAGPAGGWWQLVAAGCHHYRVLTIEYSWLARGGSLSTQASHQHCSVSNLNATIYIFVSFKRFKNFKLSYKK